MSQRDFGPSLHPWASKLSLRSSLSKITLAHILAGDTCEPISLSNLEAYLAFREQSLENLQFVVWFQDYRKRFLALPASEQASSPAPSNLEFPIPSNESLSSHEHTPSLSTPLSDRVLPPPSPAYTPFSSLKFRKDPVVQRNISTISPDSSKAMLLSGAGRPAQPFKKECKRVINTFLRPGAVKELPLSDDVRLRTIKMLAYSTHPDVFLPVYHEMYNILESVSVPGFLAYNSTVINYPRQVFWAAVGATCIFIGISISLSLILTVPVPPQSRRAWRIFGCIFIGLGAGYLYSSFRGFCCTMHLRNRIQLRIWELQDVEQADRTFWSKLLLDPDEPIPDLLREWDPVMADYKVLDDVGTDPEPAPDDDLSEPKSPSSTMYPTHHVRRSSLAPLHLARNGFNRPPVFGPNKVVLDPRIRALHRQLLIEVLSLSFLSAVIFAAIVVPVPSLNR